MDNRILGLDFLGDFGCKFSKTAIKGFIAPDIESLLLDENKFILNNTYKVLF